jgi:cytochrome c-type biogenesis protein CcmH/NrfG
MRTSVARRFVALAIVSIVSPVSVLVAGAANAADTDTPTSPASTASTVAGAPTTKAPSTPSTTATNAGAATVDHMAIGRTAVAKSDWKLAVAEFTAAVAANAKDADANNLLAYSYRKSGDLTNAFKYYKVALGIDPKHKGALEYQGEAYVISGKMKDAKANLAKLKAAGCGTTCENYIDLAAFIAKPPKKK